MAEIRPIARSVTGVGYLLGRKLDSIPFSGYHILIITVLALVGFIEGYDLVLTGSLLVLAKAPLQLTGPDIRWLIVGPGIMLCIGGFASSAVSDHFSRKTIMLIGVIATTFFTLLIPLVQTAEQLIIVRLLTGLGAGGVVSAAFPIAAELMPAQHRRTYGAIYEVALAISFTVVPFIASLLAGNSNAFRFLALPGGLAITVVPVLVYFVIPESPRSHLRRGHPQAAADIVNRIIRRSGDRVPPLTVEALGDHREAAREKLPPYWALFARGQLRWTTVGILSGPICAATAFVLISVLLPKALVDQGAAVSLELRTHLAGVLRKHSGKGLHRLSDGDHRPALDDFLCSRRLVAGPVLDAAGASGGGLRDSRDGNGRTDHRLYRAIRLHRDARLSIGAVPDGIARPWAYFR